MRLGIALLLAAMTALVADAGARVGPEGFDHIAAQREELLPKAEAGDRAAQVALGNLYKNEKGADGKPDYENAARWFQKAAEQGDPHAQVELGVFYWNGFGVEKDHDQAFKWMKMAADQDYPRGYGAVGNAYLMGWGVKQDYAEAAKWLRKAAEKGNVIAQVRLGRLYREGMGVPEDGKQAEYWFLKAAGQESDPFQSEAYLDLGLLYEKGAKDIKASEKEAIRWYEGAVDRSLSRARVQLANVLSDGKGKEDQARALKLYQGEAENGNTDAMNNLGILYGSYKGGNPEKEIYWLEKAAEKGHPYAYYNLGGLYKNGRGVPKDLNKAYENYSKAAQLGDKEAIQERDALRKVVKVAQGDKEPAAGHEGPAPEKLSIRSLSFKSNPISPGQEGMIVLDYAPPAEGTVKINAAFALWFGGKQVVPTFHREFELSKANTVQIITLPIPVAAEKGLYKITIQAEARGHTAKSEVAFVVKDGVESTIRPSL